MATLTITRCDRCGAFGDKAVVREVEIIEHVGECAKPRVRGKPLAGDTITIPDLCVDCRKALEVFLGGRALATEHG